MGGMREREGGWEDGRRGLPFLFLPRTEPRAQSPDRAQSPET